LIYFKYKHVSCGKEGTRRKQRGEKEQCVVLSISKPESLPKYPFRFSFKASSIDTELPEQNTVI